MFTLSVVLGSSILYKDFNSATPQRLLKFIFGCISTFIGVYLITSKRPLHHVPKPRRSIPRLPSIGTAEEEETSPLLIDVTGQSQSSEGLGETPPHLLGTGFGYHFTNPRILEMRGPTRSTLPRGARKRDDLASVVWTKWGNSDDGGGGDGNGHEELHSERMNRTQSERAVVSNVRNEDRRSEEWSRDAQSDTGIEQDGKRSWPRNRGYSAV